MFLGINLFLHDEFLLHGLHVVLYKLSVPDQIRYCQLNLTSLTCTYVKLKLTCVVPWAVYLEVFPP